MKRIQSQFLFILIIVMMSCQSDNKDQTSTKSKPVRLVTLDPGHFHAALVQKSMYDDVDSVVYVYAPEGNDLKLHLDRINAYNSRAESPTSWKEIVYTGNDFFEKMIDEKKGNVVVLSGNNAKKTEYILKALEAGFNVLADKPMAITPEDFELLKKAFDVAKEKDLLLYDIMTERFEINTILQREISMIPEIFGTLDTGSVDHPAVEMTSDHNFYKNVSGNIVVRPPWFMDASQQGNGIVDVTTHLVDLVQWECFPEQKLDYTKDIAITAAKRWPTDMTVSQFKTITKLNEVPAFIEKDKQNDSLLKVWSNGEINYTVKGVHAKVTVVWSYQTESGSDTHHSIIRGSKANLVIRQGKEENFKPVLYIEPIKNDAAFQTIVEQQFSKISTKFPSVELYKTARGWSVKLPEKLAEGHESHFARVTNNFLEYLKNKNMPAWEVPNMLAKYYTTTKALEIALKKK
ncbi:MAG TPA: putative oxidoreductase C-terminal domain-containing protein [Chitinophagaceae bacterium]|nr:putative oxidoreductase C-terminal domain-containing protein [Chitinophagaceae bacterium]